MESIPEYPQTWLTRPQKLELPGGEVHVWKARLDRSPATIDRLARSLPEEESSRASRFRLEQDRRRFIVARGSLRAILSGYLNRPPGQIRFAYNLQGKPRLAEPFEGLFTFNLSHSGELALYAVARGVRVGIDLELIRPYFEYLPIAERYFTSEEQELLRTLPEERQAETFFNFWTRKEAYLKAKGGGLSVPLEEASFLPVQIGRGGSLVIQDHQNGDSFWTAYTLSPAPHYIATLLVEERGWRIKCFCLD